MDITLGRSLLPIFKAEVRTALPRLAWLAAIDRRSLTTEVVCGRSVEVQDGFTVEGTWEGPFRAGEMDAAAHLFGSGVRARTDAVMLCASSALVDRLVYVADERRALCSNSLPLLLAAAGARLDDAHDYTAECRALMHGRRLYPRALHAVAADAPLRLNQVYGENLRIDRDRVTHAGRPEPVVSLRSYAEYEQALRTSLQALCANLHDGARRIPCDLLGTVSTGYDSAAAAALGIAHGLTTCFTTSPAVDPALEDGAAVARALGLQPILLSRSAPEAQLERALLSSTLDGRESVFASMAAQLREQPGMTALLTGYHGDKIWGCDTSGPCLSPDVMRGDTSGLNLSEVRLHAGFVNLALPFLHAPRIAEVVAISNSPEMAPWRLDNGYDRPIPRRIVEGRGVPRELFGQRKSVVMDYALWPRNDDLRRALRAHLRRRHGYGRLAHLMHEASGIADYRLARVRGGSDGFSLRARLWPAHRQLANRIFVWAVNQSAQELATALDQPRAA